MFRKVAGFAMVAALALVACTGAALAQANCDEYGRLALKQQKENETRKCGFAGDSWHPKLEPHVAWCKSVGPEQWKEQLQKRAQALAGCTAK
jgi:hypothetical protein